MKKHLLITNDDGINSAFLLALVEALRERFRISIAAPASEQSWIGRAMSRHREVTVEPHPEFDCPAWTIGGTPTDCVNIALGNLMREMPDGVVSGINIGYNTSIPLIYSSGTIAGAMEGAFWGLPAFAVSQEVPDHLFSQATGNNGSLPDDFTSTLAANARHAAEFIALSLHDNPGSSKEEPRRSDAIVQNLNYPAQPRLPYQTLLTVPVPLRETPFYEKNTESAYFFRYRSADPFPSAQKTDREAIAEGAVSHSVLNFSALGRDQNH